jgi:hypothetical protein
MIKWRGSIKGKETIGFGLSAGNVARLRKGYPIFIHGKDMGLGFDIMIHYGLNEETMYREIKDGGFITEDTVIHKE